jgi:hypothetical protein
MEAKRQRILEEAARVERDMRELERILYEYKLRVVADPETVEPVEQRDRVLPSGAKEEAEAIIRTAGYPMAITDIALKLSERGIEFDTARDYIGNLTATLLRSTELRYLPKVGWWLKNVSWPPSQQDIENLRKPKEERQKGRRRSPEKEQLYKELRRLIEGRTEPTLYRDIYDHIEKLGIPIGGKDPKANLSAFMTSLPEFRSHGPNGRAGWTFEANRDWNFYDGFKGEESRGPNWRHHPVQRKVVDTARDLLRGRADRMQTNDLFEAMKARGVEFPGVKPDREQAYVSDILREVPFFDVVRMQGWRYLPELDEESP